MRRRPHGIALLLTVGILTLLAFAGMALVGMASRLGAAGAAVSDRAAAGLLAHSGVEYASSRLFQDDAPRNPPTRANQPDDWTCRDDAGVPLEQSRNPSYAQAEPYDDSVSQNGRYDSGLDGYTDVNGNGRFDAWSGRLRTRQGMIGGTFALRIAGAGGKIDVNDGILDGLDRDGDKIPDCRDLQDSGRGLPEDELALRNLRTAALLDALGEVSGVSDPRIGRTIVQGRPQGGYRSLGEIRGKLSQGDWDRLRDCLSIGSAEHSMQQFVRRDADPLWPYGAGLRQRVNLSTAPVPVLKALVLGLCPAYELFLPPAPPPGGDPGDLMKALIKDPRLQDLWNQADDQFEKQRRTAYNEAYKRYNQLAQGAGYLDSLPIPPIDPGEAEAIARYWLAHRPVANWHDLYLQMDRDSPSLLPSRVKPAAAQKPYKDWWVEFVAADLNPESAASPEYAEAPYAYPAMGWLSYDILRADELPQASGDPRRGRLLSKTVWRQDRSDPSGGLLPFGTVEISLSPEWAFTVQSLGRTEGRGRLLASRWSSATIRTAEKTISARTQQDFENLPGPSGNAEGLRVLGRPSRDRIQSEPQFSLDSCPDSAGRPHYRSSPYWGTLRLMDFSSGRYGNERFYAPAWEQGQPLRAPEQAADSLENFRDAAGKAEFTLSWPSPPPAGEVPPEDAFLESGERNIAAAARPATQALGTYRWQSVDNYPIAQPDGAIRDWSLEFWGAMGTFSLFWGSTVNMTLPLMGTQPVPWLSGVVVMAIPAGGSLWAGSYSVMTLLGSTFPSSLFLPASPPRVLRDWHHVGMTFDAGTGEIAGFVNGIRDPFLSSFDWESSATNPASGGMFLSSPGAKAPTDETRLYPQRLHPALVQAHASQSRYWIPDEFVLGDLARLLPDRDPAGLPALQNRLTGVPCWTSPLYVPDRPARISGAGWDGYVPQSIRSAASASVSGEAVPLRVEILCYGTFDGSGTPRRVSLPDTLWLAGGGWSPLHAADVCSFRYRVWMNAGTVAGFNPESPVLDSVTVRYGAGGRRLDWSEE